MNRIFLRSTSLLIALCLTALQAQGQSIDDMQKNAIQFLEVTQAADGSWTSWESVGITSLVTTSLLTSGKSERQMGRSVPG